jgi:hypothetical protein
VANIHGPQHVVVVAGNLQQGIVWLYVVYVPEGPAKIVSVNAKAAGQISDAGRR